RAVDQELQLLALDGGEVGQDVVGRVLPARRPPDPEPYPHEVLVPQRLRQRPYAVVPALAATLLEAQLAVRDVQLVVDRDDTVDRYLVELAERGDRPAGQVHVRHRLDEHQPRRLVADPQPGLGHLGDRAPGPAEPGARTVRQQIDNHESDVVPVL